MKLEQKLGLLVTHIGSSHDPLYSAVQPLYLGILEDFKNDPYISICVKGKLLAKQIISIFKPFSSYFNTPFIKDWLYPGV
jgi:hypothetical protein